MIEQFAKWFFGEDIWWVGLFIYPIVLPIMIAIACGLYFELRKGPEK